MHFACEVARPRDHRLHRLQGVAPDGPVYASGARCGPAGRGRCGTRHRADRRPRRRRCGDRHRRAQVLRVVRQPAERARARPSQSVLDRPDHSESRGRLGLDRARDEGPSALPVHGVRRVEHGDRRRDGRDPARPGRRDDLRRYRGTCDARQHRRIRRDARDLATKRRPRARLAPVRRRARRLRHGRGGGNGRDRGARAREGARREDLCGAPRVRGLVRREPRLRPRPERREPGEGARDGVRRRRHRAGGGRVRQRARHLDARPATPARRACSRSRSARRRPIARRSPRRKAPRGTASGPQARSRRSSRSSRSSAGILPPTINQTTPDPTCDLDYIPNEARHEQVEVGVSNSFGFGGHNACLVFRRWHDDP